MPSDHDRPDPERRQTDQSLREERAHVDTAPSVNGARPDDAADAVLTRARALADERVTAARAASDRKATGRPTKSVERMRLSDDQVVREQRTEADAKRRAQRAVHVEHLQRDRDETDRDLLSERKRADGALAMRDEFMGVVSHDLRNLLNNMMLAATLITQQVKGEVHASGVTKQARQILSSGARMNRLIGDLVDVASIDTGALELCRAALDPALVVAEAVRAFQGQAAEKQLSLVCAVEPGQLLAAYDSTRILQVLANLIGNAIAFTPAQGTVRVHAEAADGDVRFMVSDSGPGIPADELGAVFDRFHQVTRNDRRGVGLGLYIARCIVLAHGGQMWAESELGQWTTVFFTLPTVPAVAVPAQAPPDTT